MPLLKASTFLMPFPLQLPGEAGGGDGGAAPDRAQGSTGGEGAAETAGPAADQRHPATGTAAPARHLKQLRPAAAAAGTAGHCQQHHRLHLFFNQ